MNCPVISSSSDKILLAHGSGGKLSAQLIDSVFLASFGQPDTALHDSALLSCGEQRLAFTTDSYVVHPLFFPGGNIGDLAVNGTINDLAVAGAAPLALSCGFILEEGFPIEQLQRITASMRQAADRVGVQIVTGDTKVVERGKGDGVYINTSGVGLVKQELLPRNIQPGDAILVSGDIGRHGTAILSVREGLTFGSSLISDTQQLHSLMHVLLQEESVHCARDLTRGGLATVLLELAVACGHGFSIEEEAVPLDATVEGACEFLGLDPLFVACEGRLVAFVPEAQAESALQTMQRFDPTAARIGSVGDSSEAQVVATTCLGTRRILKPLVGEQLPRIC